MGKREEGIRNVLCKKEDMMRVSEMRPRTVITPMDEATLHTLARQKSIPTSSGNLLYRTNVMSRSAGMTRVIYDTDQKIGETLRQVGDYLRTHDCFGVDREIGRSGPARFSVRLYITKENPQIALMFHKNFFAPSFTPRDRPDITVIDIPEWPKTEILIFPKEATTIILGSNYYGEAKMASLRMAMYLAREERDALGLHAGSKEMDILADGKITPKGILVFGLSGTGKTTIICEDHGLARRVKIMQDDIIILDRRAIAYGTERNFYVKTDNIKGQQLLFDVALHPEAIWENVFVDANGAVDFDNHSLSTNGRAIIPRDKITLASPFIDLDKVDFVFFNTRRYDIPPLGKLVSAEQAAAFYMLGESIITSADDPTRVGETKRVVGFDPFIVDHHEKNGNRLLEILTAHPRIQCYILNTGKVGGMDNGVKITPEITLKIVEEVVRGNVKWEQNPDVGYDLPVAVPGVDLAPFDPYAIYGKSVFASSMEELRRDRFRHLETFSGLDPRITNSISK